MRSKKIEGNCAKTNMAESCSQQSRACVMVVVEKARNKMFTTGPILLLKKKKKKKDKPQPFKIGPAKV